jgi:hypothetical protein
MAQYFIKNKFEIVGLFKSVEDAQIYSLKKIVIECLNLEKHNKMNNAELERFTMSDIRLIEELIEDIIELNIIERDENILYLMSILKERANLLLNNSKYNLCYTIERFEENNICTFFI